MIKISEKSPKIFISHSSLDKEYVEKLVILLRSMIEISSDCTRPFIQSMEALSDIYNGKTEIYFDDDNLYLARAD